MSDAPKNSEVLRCPFCEGRGEIEKDLLLERLREKDLGRKVESYLSDIVAAESSEELHGVPVGEATKHEANTWNLTHFLWRRSPKE
jgi:hypothetical protein